MREASQYLLGTHDFRNFCKMDVGNGVINYTRNILQLTIDAPTGDDSYNMCELTIQGQAFLWHQVRCVVAILFLIGQRKENPDLVKELLDVDKNPRFERNCFLDACTYKIYANGRNEITNLFYGLLLIDSLCEISSVK